MPQVPYSPPGAEQGQHMYVDIYQALYRDRSCSWATFSTRSRPIA